MFVDTRGLRAVTCLGTAFFFVDFRGGSGLNFLLLFPFFFSRRGRSSAGIMARLGSTRGRPDARFRSLGEVRDSRSARRS